MSNYDEKNWKIIIILREKLKNKIKLNTRKREKFKFLMGFLK